MKSITFTLKPNDRVVLPFAHFEMLQGLFYKIISHNNELSTSIHNSKNIKLLCFSDLIGRYSIEDSNIVYKELMQWEVRCVDDSIIDAISEIIFSKSNYELNHCPFKIVNIKLNSITFGGHICFRVKTPIVTNKTYDGFRHYYSPNDNEFYEIIKNNLKKKYEAVFNAEYNDRLEIKCINENSIKKCVTRFKGNYITGWYSEFEINAKPDMINIAYYSGIGSNNSIGFGFIGDIISK